MLLRIFIFNIKNIINKKNKNNSYNKKFLALLFNNNSKHLSLTFRYECCFFEMLYKKT